MPFFFMCAGHGAQRLDRRCQPVSESEPGSDLEVQVHWGPWWREPLAEQQLHPPRGGVGRKLQAKLWPEEHEPHMRRLTGGREGIKTRSPMPPGSVWRICGGYVERKSRALPREVCLSATG